MDTETNTSPPLTTPKPGDGRKKRLQEWFARCDALLQDQNEAATYAERLRGEDDRC